MSQGAPARRARSKSHRPARDGGVRTRLGLATASPWLRAPFLLVRFPGLLLAIGSALVILSVAGASSPLFLSSAGNATLQDGIAATCPWDVALTHQAHAPVGGEALNSGFFYNQPSVDALAQIRSADALMNRVDRGIGHLGPPELQIVGITIQVSGGTSSALPRQVRLYTRPGAFSHVQTIGSAGGKGVWLPASAATAFKVEPGDSVTLTNVLGVGPRTAKVRVAAVYRDLVTLPRARFWCWQDHLIYPLSVFDNRPPPPPFLIADEATFLSLSRKLGERDAEFTWVFPVQPRRLTVPEAQTLVANMQAIGQKIGARTPGTFFGGYASPLGGPGRTSSQLSFIADKAEATQAALRGPVQAISLAARAVALMVVAAAGIYWVDRRRAEVHLLSAKGVGSVGLGTKVLLEALPIAAGAAFAGWAAGVWLAKILGPTDLLDAGAPSAALRQVLWTTAVGVVFLSIVGGYGAHRAAESEPVRGHRALGAAPWELAVLGLAGAALYEILTRGTQPVQNGVPKIDFLIVLFPILFIAGGAGIAVRGLRRLLPKLRASGRSWPSPAYLASRRLAAASRIAVALVTAAALAIGILSYAGALRSSLGATTNAKALLFTGSDVSVTVAENIEVPRSLSPNATAVTQIDSAYTLPDQTLVSVLGVDRATFARAAFWDSSFASASLGQILEELKPPQGGSAPLPVLVAGGSVPTAPGESMFFRGGNVEIPIRVVETARAFPGMAPDEPLVVADRQALAERKAPGLRAIWTKGDAGRAEQAIRAQGAHILAVATTHEIQRNPSFLPFSWVFGFLQALGIMAGLIVLVGILLYLEARQRGRAISYALASQMGLSRRSHRTSVALELGVLLALGCVVGIGLARIAARIVYGRLDPLPQLPPAPLFRLPLAVFGLTALAVLAAAWLGAWRVQHAAERARVSEVMRVAG
ncbi:MAG: FtsX-like permease family protein [Actinobacteria bacterium]|nr:MAG: FtsX-like permease family protein [Actinomycetota bacterium]